MARPREFDIDTALDAAMGVFWARGYEGTSLRDLLAAMGIARGSLYKAFRDKHAIYLAALDRYDRSVIEDGVMTLSNSAAGDGLDRIRHFLAAAARSDDRRGCFLCNAAVDRAPLDVEVRTRVRAMMDRLERAIAKALAQSRAAGDWPVERRADTARLLTGTYMGLRVLAKAGYPAAELDCFVNASLSPFEDGAS